MAVGDVDSLIRDFLLVPGRVEGNVVLHVIPDGVEPSSRSRLRLAADLAEHRSPREELRALQLLRELAEVTREVRP